MCADIQRQQAGMLIDLVGLVWWGWLGRLSLLGWFGWVGWVDWVCGPRWFGGLVRFVGLIHDRLGFGCVGWVGLVGLSWLC